MQPFKLVPCSGPPRTRPDGRKSITNDKARTRRNMSTINCISMLSGLIEDSGQPSFDWNCSSFWPGMNQCEFGAFHVGTSAVNPTSRTNYACDACRRQKIKCNGSQPCKKCLRSGLRCTYGSLSGRSSVGYVRQLEQKVAELQALVQKQPAGIDSTAHERDSLGQGSWTNSLIGREDDYIIVSEKNHPRNCIGRSGGLDGALFDYAEAFMGYCGAQIAQAFDSATFEMPEMASSAGSAILLPPQEELQNNVSIALNSALDCMECFDRDELWPQIHVLYQKSLQNYEEHDKSILALVHALMALGRRYAPSISQTLPEYGSHRILVGGFGYFRTSRTILDSLQCADLMSIVASCYLANYLLSVSMLSKAYSCIGTAASLALRMGLHSLNSVGIEMGMSIDELNKRRRVFAVLKRMDTVISDMLGSPELLRYAGQYQSIVALDTSVEEGAALIDRRPMSPLTEAMYSAQLYQILTRILRYEDRPSKLMASKETELNLDPQAMTDFEEEIRAWHRSLPNELPEDIDQRTLRSQMLLRLQHAGVELSLYRSFLHHLARDKDDLDFQYQGYAFGSSCLRASTQIVYIVESMDKQGFLHEAQAYTLYLLALAATSLVFFVLKWKEGPTVEESRTALDCAMVLLATYGQKNVSAQRCHLVLAGLLEEGNYSEHASGWSKSRFMRAIGAIGEDLPISEARL